MRLFLLWAVIAAGGPIATGHAQEFSTHRSVPAQLQEGANRAVQRAMRNVRGVYMAPRGSHPGESTIRGTKLFQIFAAHPSGEYPRVALTVLRWTPFGTMRFDTFAGELYLPKDECWEYRATLWTGPDHHEAIAPFSVCLGDYGSDTPIDGVARWAVWAKGPEWDSTGYDRTIGPRPPSWPTPRNASLHLDVSVGNRETVHLANLLMQLGFDWGNPQDGRVWLVGFGANTPEVESGVSELSKEQAKIDAGWDELMRKSRAQTEELLHRTAPAPPDGGGRRN